MDIAVSALLVGGVLIFFLAIGTWVFSALFLTGVISLLVIADYNLARVGAILQPSVWKNLTGWEVSAIPLFLWMSELIVRSKMAEQLFSGLAPFVRWLPGRLHHTNVLACSMFSAVSGSSIATAATVGNVTVPELVKKGYDARLVIGSLCGAGTLGILIPPSIVLIIYGVLAEVSIAKLFMAGVLPGILFAGLFTAYVAGRCILQPQLMPSYDSEAAQGVLRSIMHLAPIITLIVIIMGGIYSGLVTPSESAAFGVLATLMLMAVRGELSFGVVTESLAASVRLTAMICAIMIGASFLSVAMALLQIPAGLTRWIMAMDLSPTHIIVALVILYVVLGAFLDGLSLMVLTLPLALPLVTAAGWDPIWFGVFLVVMIELGAISPPVGLNLFVVQALTGRDLGFVVRASLPFFILMLIGVSIMIAFPSIALFLPEYLSGR